MISGLLSANFDLNKFTGYNLTEPKDNKGIFTALAEAEIISEESLSFMIPMAGTRNILVHGYDKVDETLIYGILKKHIEDFSFFIKQVRENYLQKQMSNNDDFVKSRHSRADEDL